MPEVKIQCPECQVTIRLASLPNQSAIACPKCRGRVPLRDEAPRPAPRPRPRRRDDWEDVPRAERRGPLFGGELYGAIGLVVLCIPLAIICFFGAIPAAVGIIGMWLVVMTLSMWGGIWLLVIAFQEEAIQGILCLFVPFYSLYYIISRFGECYRPLVVQAGGLLCIPLIIIGAVGAGTSIAKNEMNERAENGQAPPSGSGGGRRGGRNPAPPVNLPKTWAKDRNDPAFIDLALEDMRSNDPDHRRDAAQHLSEMRPNNRRKDVVRTLEILVKDSVGSVRARAIKALGVWGDKDHFPLYLNALKDSESEVARAGFEIVSKEKDDRAIAPLIDSLSKLHDDAARELREYGKKAEPELVKALNHPDREVRRRVADLLSEMGSDATADAMIEALKSNDREVKEKAVEFFMKKSDPRAAEPLAECLKDHAFRHNAAAALRKLGPAAEKAVIALAGRAERFERREVFLLLKDIGTKESVPVLRTILLENDHDREQAREALKAIALRYPKDFPADKPPIWEVDPVTQALADLKTTDLFKKRKGLETLLRLEPTAQKDEVVKAVEPLLRDGDFVTRGNAVTVYGVWSGPEGVPTVIKLLTDDDLHTRRAAMTALGKTKDPRAVAPLCLRLVEGIDRQEAVKALKEFGVKAQLEVSKYCDHRDTGTRHEATKLLGQIGDKDAIPALQKLMNQKQDRRLSDIATQAMQELRVRISAADKEKK